MNMTFYTAGKIYGEFNYDLPRVLASALIEYLYSGFDTRDLTTYGPPTNVYTRVDPDGNVSSEKRPMWPMNMETPAIKGLIYSVGLDLESMTIEHATDFTDGVTTQRMMYHSGAYRKEVVSAIIKVLGNFAFNNDFLTADDVKSFDKGWNDMGLWSLFLERI